MTDRPIYIVDGPYIYRRSLPRLPRELVAIVMPHVDARNVALALRRVEEDKRRHDGDGDAG